MEAALTKIAGYLWAQSWQIALTFAVVAAACRALRRASAHWRYLLWLVVLVKCIVPPVVTVPLRVLPPAPAVEAPAVEAPPAGAPVAEAPVAEPPAIGVAGGAPLPTEAPAETHAAAPAAPTGGGEAPAAPLTFAQWAAAVWLAGAAGLLSLGGCKAWRIHRRLRQTRRPADGYLLSEVASLSGLLGLRGVPQTYLVDGIRQPFVWGLWRGGLYLPGDFGEITTAVQRRAVLMHELAHVWRRDPAVNALQAVVQGLLFFHPLVWCANRRAREEREKCCDEIAVVALGVPARRYGASIVEALVNGSEATRTPACLGAAGPSRNIEKRIKTIMNDKRRFYRRPTWAAGMTALLLAALLGPMSLVLMAREDPSRRGAAGASAAGESIVMVPCVEKHSVMLVVGEDGMTFQGKQTTWQQLPSLLEKVPNRGKTAFCVAVTDPSAYRGTKRRELMSRAHRACKPFGFEGLSFIGRHPLGAKGAARYEPTITPADWRAGVPATPAARRLLGLWTGVAIDKPGEGTSEDPIALEVALGRGDRIVCTVHGRFVLGGREEARGLRIEDNRIEFQVRHRSGISVFLRSSLPARPTDATMRVVLRLKGRALVGEAKPVVEGDSCDIRLKRVTSWPPKGVRVSRADAKALAGRWRGMAADQPPGSSRDPMTLELSVTEDGKIAGTASGQFASSGLGRIWNLRVDGPQIAFEALHRTGARMGVRLTRKGDELVGTAKPLDMEEDSCDITLRRVKPLPAVSKPITPQQARRLCGVWRGAAADKPGEGISLDLLTLKLEADASGHLGGTATGRFVRGGRTDLEKVRVEGDRVAFVLLHRTGVRVEACVHLDGNVLRGDCMPIDTTEDACDILLERQPAGRRAVEGLWYGLATDKPGQGTSVDAVVLDVRRGPGEKVAGALYGHFSRHSAQKVKALRVEDGEMEFEALHRTGIRMKITLKLKDGKLVGDAVPIDVDGDACDITLQRPVKGAKEPTRHQWFGGLPRLGGPSRR